MWIIKTLSGLLQIAAILAVITIAAMMVFPH